MHPVDIETGLYRIPSRTLQQNSTHTFREYEYIVTRINFNGGIQGIGYTYTQGTGGTAILHLINDYLSKRLINDGVGTPSGLYREMWDSTYSFGLEGISRLAYASIDLAYHDATAKNLGVPLYVYLGGDEDSRIRAYRSAIDLNMSVKELTDDIRRHKADGYRAFKIKVGREDFSEDLERLDAVRDVIGEEATLMVDANRKWGQKESLIKGRKLQEKDVYWLEEPVETDMLPAYSFLRDRLDMFVAGGESIYNSYEMEQFISNRCVDISQIDVIRAGGVREWMRLSRLAEAFGIKVAPHFAEEIAVQVLCAIDNAIFLEHLPGSNLRDSGLMKDPFRIEKGYAYPGREPGNGINFDWEKLEKFRVV